jgi:hypothetical protein
MSYVEARSRLTQINCNVLFLTVMHNPNEIRERNPRFVIAGVITALMLLGTTTVAISTVTTPENVFAYRNSQATSQVNDCGSGELPLNVGCQNTDSQIQGDRNSVALSSQQTFPPPPPTTGTLIVIKIVQCVAGQQCPGLPDPSIFEIDIASVCENPLGDCNDLARFPGSSEGTTLTLEPGIYRFDTETFDSADIPPGLRLISGDTDSGCRGTIQAGQEITCTVTNTFRPVAQTP